MYLDDTHQFSKLLPNLLANVDFSTLAETPVTIIFSISPSPSFHVQGYPIFSLIDLFLRFRNKKFLLYSIDYAARCASLDVKKALQFNTGL